MADKGVEYHGNHHCFSIDGESNFEDYESLYVEVCDYNKDNFTFTFLKECFCFTINRNDVEDLIKLLQEMLEKTDEK